MVEWDNSFTVKTVTYGCFHTDARAIRNFRCFVSLVLVHETLLRLVFLHHFLRRILFSCLGDVGDPVRHDAKSVGDILAESTDLGLFVA